MGRSLFSCICDDADSGGRGMEAAVPAALEVRRRTGTGQVTHLLDARLQRCSTLYQRHLRAHYGCVNALEFSDSGALLASGGDDRRVLLWDVARTVSGGRRPVVAMTSQHLSNIFCLAFDPGERRVLSAGNDKQIIVHDIASGAAVDVFTEQQAVYGLSVNPCQENIFVAACESGRVLMFDLRLSLADPHPLAESGASLAAYYSAMFSPAEPRLVATANSKTGAAIYDVRMSSRPLERYGVSRYGAMSARFSSDGRRLFLLRRRLPPALYDLQTPETPLCQFDHPQYYNSCTMKSCCFAGSRDQLVLSGSDDFNVYLWRIPDDPGQNRVCRAQAVLRGHRSIVNQVRYCPRNGLIASSGVEKIIKLWSPLRLPDSGGGLSDEVGEGSRPPPRRVARQGEYVDMVVNAGELFGPESQLQSTEEDPRMLAFFDSLVQREIEALTTETDSSEEEDGRRRTSGGPAEPEDQLHSYFAGSELDCDTAAAGSPSDDVISRLIEVKRGQLMRAARRRRQRASGRPPSSDPEPPDSARHYRHHLHKARYVWLPMGRGGRPAPPAACVDSTSSEEVLRRRLSSDADSDADSSSGGSPPRPCLRPPPAAADGPSGSGLQARRPPPPAPPSSSSSSASEEEEDTRGLRRRVRRKLAGVERRLPEEQPSPPPPADRPDAAPLTNGHTKDNFSRLKRRDLKHRNYRRRH